MAGGILGRQLTPNPSPFHQIATGTAAGALLGGRRQPLNQVYPVGAGADESFCQRPNSFPCGSRQVENQPMFGTGRGSSASPPSSFTRAAPALISSTSK